MNDSCQRLHALAHQLVRHRFPFDPKSIPKNGLYLLFEKGEGGHGGERIVRIGTHTGNGNLRSRLQEHFVKENKDRSIFRKSIGRALLSRDNDPYLQIWNFDRTGRKNLDKCQGVDLERQLRIERQVTAHIQTKLSFCVLPVLEKHERLALEAKAIGTVASCAHCTASRDWLGSYSPDERIRTVGLWQVQHLQGPVLTASDFEILVGVSGR